MITDLEPYADYKESGLPWLGNVPGHWSVRRIKTVLRVADSRSEDGVGTLLSLTRVRGLIPHRDMTDKMHSAKTLVGYKRYRAGQIVMNRMQAWSGMFGAGDIDGLVSPDYAVFDVLGGHAIKSVLERLKAPDLVGQFALESKGIGSGFNRLYTDRFGPIAISLPPAAEQEAIVRFLNWANGRLEKAIRAKRKVIALLNEQKQAIIHRAVTRGLDPSVPLRPSGIPWLGDIPQHWELRRLKSFVSNVTDQTRTMGNDETYIALENVESWTGIVKPQNQEDEILFIGQVKRFATNDVLFGKLRPYLAKVITAKTNGVCVGEFFVLRPKHSVILPCYLEQLLRSRKAIDVINGSTFGSKMPRTDWQFMGSLRLALPPVSEQQLINESISLKTRPLNTATARTEREIALMQEYRTRLTADVVTGKLDVREAATKLPDETPVETGPDESDLEDETADEELVA